jgi:hypothetical protein
VDARIAGKGERRFVETKDEAEGWASVQRVRRRTKETALSTILSFPFMDFLSPMRSSSLSITTRRQAGSAPVDEVVRQLLASKRAAGRAESYLYVLNFNLGKLTAYFDGR